LNLASFDKNTAHYKTYTQTGNHRFGTLLL